jgi:hypothetical protein
VTSISPDVEDHRRPAWIHLVVVVAVAVGHVPVLDRTGL